LSGTNFQGGCTDPAHPAFNPEARVDDGSCPATGIRAGVRPVPALVKFLGRRVQLAAPFSGAIRVRILDLQGHTLWRFNLSGSATFFDLPDGLLPGLYHLEFADGKNLSHARLLIP
jgi:hypothetical protein